MPEEKDKDKKEVIPLISIYLKDDEIAYNYSDDNSEIIIANNLLLCGNLDRIKQELLDLDLEEEDEE